MHIFKFESNSLQFCISKFLKMNFSETYINGNLILNYIDKEDDNINSQRFHPQAICDESHINFTDLLEKQWTINSRSQSDFTNYQPKVFQDIRAESAVEGSRSVASLVQSTHSFGVGLNRTKKQRQNKAIEKNIKLRSVSTVMASPQKIDDMNLFLESSSFTYMLRFVVLLNIVGLVLTDYNFRLQQLNGTRVTGQYSMFNILSLHFQLFSNSIFTMEIIIRLLATDFFQNWWNVLNLISTFACWSTIFLDFEEHDGEAFFEFIMIFRIIRCLRAIQVFEQLKKPFQVFLTTIPALSKIFFPLFIFLIFYATTGMTLFSGATQNRCRLTPEPQTNATFWPQLSPVAICGASTWQCPVGFCGNPHTYGLPYSHQQDIQKTNQYGLVSFDNFLKAILTVFHYVFLSNWTSIKYKFSRFVNPYVTSFYFVSLAVFLFFITANLIMISLCKAYIEKEKLYQKFGESSDQRDQQQEQKKLPSIQQTSDFLKALKVIDSIVIIMACIIMAIDFQGISSQLTEILSIMDFSLTWVALIIITIRLAIIKKEIILDAFNFLDWIVVLVSVADVFYSLIEGDNVINPERDIHKLLRALKFMRLVKLIFFSKSRMIYQRKIVNLFFQTLKTMKYFLLLFLFVVLTFSLIGQNLFAYRVRFNHHNQVDILHGEPYVVNFENLYKSIIHIVVLFENERWTQTMYNYYYAVGFKAIIFFILTCFIVHLMLTRLFIAIFLCYFRRNLQKREDNQQFTEVQSEANVGVRTIKKIDIQIEEKSSISSPDFLRNNQQDLQNAVNDTSKKKKSIQTQNQKLFWYFDKNSFAFRISRAIHNSTCFYYIVMLALTIHAVTLVIRTGQDSDEKQHILAIIQKIPIGVYFLQLAIGILGNGFYFQHESYLKNSLFNGLNLFICVFILVAQIPIFDELYRNNLRRIMVIKVFIIFKGASKEMSIILQSLRSISKKFIRVFTIFIFVLLITCIIPLKLQKNDFYTCSNFYSFGSEAPKTFQDCLNAGGDWIKQIQSFNNILSSLLLMYQIVTSESWTYFIEKSNQNQFWDLYFVGIFFVFNICTLNIFVGLIVETYLELKDKAFKLNLLKPNQRGWMLIKNCINQLVPQPSVQQPQESNYPRFIAFKVVTHIIYQNAVDLLAYVNTLIFILKVYRGDEYYLNILQILDNTFVGIFVFDTLLKLYALRSSYMYLANSRIQVAGTIVYIIYFILRLAVPMSQQAVRIISAISVVFQLLRCKKILFRFTWSKTLVNSVIQILPKCLNIGKLLFTVMFVYVSIGIELFKYVKPTSKSDNYTTGFANFYTGIMTLIKIASNQSWFDQVSAYTRYSSPIDFCYSINNQVEADQYHGMGCGFPVAFVFFVTYHVIVSLLILNLLIATMVSAYDQNYEKEYNSVNIFQLQDCLQLWQKYDPKGSGVIPYKKFWRLSSQIAILFGISKKKLIKGKQKFLQELDIAICQSIDPQDTSVLCYRFHDVITKFSKIKLQVSYNKNDENSNSIEFDIDPMVQQEIKDYKTEVPEFLYEKYRPFKNYTSAQMKYFFGLLRKLRAWRVSARYKQSNTISKLSQIIKIAMQKRQKEEVVMNLISKNKKTFIENMHTITEHDPAHSNSM